MSTTAAQRSGLLRIAFLTGAVADACALLPMLSPRLAALLWGLHDVPGSYRLAMGCSASLMLGWTLLLLWASRRPRERRAIAAITILVIAGFVGVEMWAVQAGVLAAGKVAPTLVLQAALAGLFAAAFHFGGAGRPVDT